MRYAMKLRQLPEHPAYSYVFSRDLLATFDGMTQSATPFCVRMKDLFQKSGIPLRGVRRATLLPFPPWELARPDIDLSLADTKKSEVSPSEFQALAIQHMGSYEGGTFVFTDGSKTAEGVGCAFVAGPDTRSFSLPDHASVFSAELVAIIKALWFIEVSDADRHVIFTDSLSCILALKTIYPRHPLIQDVLVRLSILDEAGKSVSFCWVPSHVGIRGNELADAAARRAASAPYTRRLPLPARDFYPTISIFAQSSWQRAWEEQRNSKLRQLKPIIKPWSSALRKNRQEEVLLCRLRIGHTYATHGHLLRGEDKPLCPRCNACLTVEHVLLSCTGLAGKRAHYLGYISPSTTLKHLLGDDSRWVQNGTIFAYIQSVNFPVIYSAY